MKMSKPLGVLLAFGFVVGCSDPAPTGPGPADTGTNSTVDASAGTDASTVDVAGTCTLPGGGVCRRGAICRHPDGCNSCQCSPGSDSAQCTLLGCVDAGGSTSDVTQPTDVLGSTDAAMGRACRSQSECSAGEDCAFPTSGCATTGYCTLPTPCFRPETFCGCDGIDITGCYPTRPARGVGSCTDGGVRACHSQSDCRTDEECRFHSAGCTATGQCGPITDCASVVPYCGCDGVGNSFVDCPGAPTRPWRSQGSTQCTADAGSPEDSGTPPDAGDRCAGAHIGRGGGYCANPADAPLPLDCCHGWDCNLAHVTCNSSPPPCAAGMVPIITMGCYGSCVPENLCAPRS